MEIKRLTATERDAMMSLGVADQIVTNAIRDLREDRYRIVPHLKRDLRMIEKVLERILERFMASIPDAQKRTYVNSLRDGSYTVGVRCRAHNNELERRDSYGLYLTFGQINALLEAAKEKCHYCGLDAEGVARCKLRKTLDEIPNDAPDSDGRDCPYYRVI